MSDITQVQSPIERARNTVIEAREQLRLAHVQLREALGLGISFSIAPDSSRAVAYVLSDNAPRQRSRIEVYPGARVAAHTDLPIPDDLSDVQTFTVRAVEVTSPDDSLAGYPLSLPQIEREGVSTWITGNQPGSTNPAHAYTVDLKNLGPVTKQMIEDLLV